MNDPKPLTEQQLDDIEARAFAAEDGWHVVFDNDTYRHEIHGDGPTHVAVFGGNPDDAFASYPVEANAEFAAHARKDVPALLAEIRRLRAEATRRVQCNDCGAVGEVFTGDDGLAYLDPSGQIGHGSTAPAEGGEQMRVR